MRLHPSGLAGADPEQIKAGLPHMETIGLGSQPIELGQQGGASLPPSEATPGNDSVGSGPLGAVAEVG